MSPDDAIFQAFEIEPSGKEAPTEEELFQLLCDRIAWMIEYNMEYLLSLLYRNDVKGSKIHFALSPFEKDPANQFCTDTLKTLLMGTGYSPIL